MANTKSADTSIISETKTTTKITENNTTVAVTTTVSSEYSGYRFISYKSRIILENENELQEIARLAQERKASGSRLSNEEKALIVKAYVTKRATMAVLSKEFGVSITSISNWYRTFAEKCMPALRQDALRQDASAAGIAADAHPTSNPQEKTPMPRKRAPQQCEEQEEIAFLKAELQRVREELKMEQLKNHVNEVIIDEAEKTFHIQIRKKSATK